jgi:hypothetical protein
MLLQVVGLTERRVASADEMLSLVREAEEARATGATSANETSSRSHAILRVHLRDAGGKVVGKLSMVDLAVRKRKPMSLSPLVQHTSTPPLPAACSPAKGALREPGEQTHPLPNHGLDAIIRATPTPLPPSP